MITLNQQTPFIILLLHSDNQSELTTKFYNFKADVGGNVLTLT